METHEVRSGRRPGRLWLALALQCLPLLAATSCATRGALGEDAQQAWFLDLRYLVVLSALAWGIGYIPLRRWVRLVVALVAGAVGNLIAANATLSAWSTQPNGLAEASLRQSSLAWLAVIVVAMLVLLVDTWRLARGDRAAARPAVRLHRGDAEDVGRERGGI